jgi:hypothetical protein
MPAETQRKLVPFRLFITSAYFLLSYSLFVPLPHSFISSIIPCHPFDTSLTLPLLTPPCYNTPPLAFSPHTPINPEQPTAIGIIFKSSVCTTKKTRLHHDGQLITTFLKNNGCLVWVSYLQ